MTDRQTDTRTHRTSTVTLVAHACRGLIIHMSMFQTFSHCSRTYNVSYHQHCVLLKDFFKEVENTGLGVSVSDKQKTADDLVGVRVGWNTVLFSSQGCLIQCRCTSKSLVHLLTELMIHWWAYLLHNHVRGYDQAHTCTCTGLASTRLVPISPRRCSN